MMADNWCLTLHVHLECKCSHVQCSYSMWLLWLRVIHTCIILCVWQRWRGPHRNRSRQLSTSLLTQLRCVVRCTCTYIYMYIYLHLHVHVVHVYTWSWTWTLQSRVVGRSFWNVEKSGHLKFKKGFQKGYVNIYTCTCTCTCVYCVTYSMYVFMLHVHVMYAVCVSIF